MTDVPSVPVDQSQQLVIYFGGFFDQSVMGAPIYFWLIFLMGMGLICLAILAAYYRYFILDKIWDFVTSYKHKTPLALVRTRYRKAYLKSLKYIAQVFSDEDGIDKWYAPALETSSNLGGVDLVEAVDYYDWMQDPILNQAVSEIIDKWGEKHPDDKIVDPNKFQKYLNEGKFYDLFEGVTMKTITLERGQIPLPGFFIVNMSKVEQYFPRNRSSSMLGGYTQHVGNDLGKDGKYDWKSAVLPVAVLCTLIIMSSIIGYIILMSAK